MPANLLKQLQDAISAENFILETNLRGRIVKSYICNVHTARSALFLEKIEPDLLDWIDKISANQIFYDLGASVGPFSIYGALRGLRVFAFEAEAQNFSALEKNHFINRENFLHDFSAFNIAISDNFSLGKIFCSFSENGATGSHQKILDNPKNVDGSLFQPTHVQAVLKYPLDMLIEKLNFPAPNYMKIDIDGAEYAALSGAKNLLRNPELKEIFIELMEGEEEKKSIAILEENGFFCESAKQVEHYVGLTNYVFSRG